MVVRLRTPLVALGIVILPVWAAAQTSTGALPPVAPSPPATASSSAPPAELPPQPPAPAPAPSPSETAAPAPAPSATAPPLPPQPAPPPGYPPYYGPPPPGWYPPPYYPYAWAPPPTHTPKPRYPDEAAAQATPFVDVLAGGVALEDRYSEFLLIGLQGGVYLASRIRIVVHALMFSSKADDDINKGSTYYYGNGLFPNGYVAIPSDSPTVLYGGAIGAAPVARQNFVFAPGISFHRTDVGDYGSMVALDLPFEWVTDAGARFGFNLDIGRAFGGQAQAQCLAGSSLCSGGTITADRPAGTAFFSAFEFGWGFNHPRPLPAEPPAE